MSIELQKQIRDNSNDISLVLTDLNRWTKEVKQLEKLDAISEGREDLETKRFNDANRKKYDLQYQHHRQLHQVQVYRPLEERYYYQSHLKKYLHQSCQKIRIVNFLDGRNIKKPKKRE